MHNSLVLCSEWNWIRIFCMKQLSKYIFLLILTVFFLRCSTLQNHTRSKVKKVVLTEINSKKTEISNSSTLTPTITTNNVEKPTSTATKAIQSDSTLIIAQDSVKTDSIKASENSLKAPVTYSAKDSMVFTKDNMGYLYGDADVKYQNIGIKGEYITMDMDSSIISSSFGVDSLGKEFGHPVFTEGQTQYEMKKVSYNFKTTKAFINTIITQQGEGWIVADQAKKNADNSFFMKDAKYTTCDLHEHPHFYLNLSKAKVRPEKDIVTGPAWLVVADVPLFPVVLPFAFFPFTKTYSSGIIMPSYGDEMARGFYLQRGGYYFAINDYVDLALTGEIYTKGTWGVGAHSNYKKRYKFMGSVDTYYLNTVTGDKGFPDYNVSKDFRLSWTHSQDPKANPFRTLSASVNYSTSTYGRNDVTELYSRRSTNDTKSSTVNITQRFPNSPWNLSGTLSLNQISRDSTIAATLPSLTATMSRIFPFKTKNAVGEERWYEKIAVSYIGEFRNTITTKENRFLKSNLIKDWTNGVRHNIPVNATFNILGYIQVTPSINYNERWYGSKIREAWDPVTRQSVVLDTVYGFNRVYDFNTSISLQTKLYGSYRPLRSIFGDKIERIRHVFTPSISMNYNPDFSDPFFRSYERYYYKDEYGNDVERVYSPYSRMMFGAPPAGKNGSIGFNFQNNLEMKIKSDKDSTGYRKVSLIDGLDIGFSYNMMADSMKWSNINTGIRLKLSKSYTLSLAGSWDPYIYQLDKDGRPVHVDKLRIMNGKGFGRLMGTGTSFSYSINQDTFKKWFGDKKKKDDEKSEDEIKDEVDKKLPSDGTLGENPHEKGAKASVFDQGNRSMGDFDEDGYLKNLPPWNISINYSLQYYVSNDIKDFNFNKMEYKGKLRHSLGLSGSLQPTKNWNFTFNTDYNFDLKKFTYMNCTLTRNLHCWSMSASFMPIGQYKSYNFVIRANASLLQDLKYEQHSSPFNNMNWY